MLGDFADQTGVPLIGRYLVYTSNNGSVVTVDATGVLRGLTAGYAAVTARRGDLAAATAVTVGTPADPLGLSNTGLSVYPGSLTLPEVGGQRQFIVKSGDTSLSGAAAGTVYIVANSSVVSITPDGFMTSAGIGETTLTIINGPVEQVVPIRVVRPAIGSATLGSDGGVVQSVDGTTIQIAPGSLPDGSRVSIAAFADVVDPLFDSVWDVGMSFELDLSGAELSEPAQIMVPVSAEFGPGETVYFFKNEPMTLADGSRQDTWLLMESGQVGSDGFARTTSPPYPGFSAGGQYRIAQADTPDRLAYFGFGAPPHVGHAYSIGPFGFGAPIGIFLPIPIFAINVSFTFLKYARSPKEIPAAVQTQTFQMPPAGTVSEAVVYLPPIDPDLVKPVIQDVQAAELGDGAKITITGLRFSGSGAKVVFRQGDHVVEVPTGGGDTSVTVAVPRDFILSLMHVRIRTPNGTSNLAYLRPVGGLGAVASTGSAATFFQTNTFTDTLVRKFQFGGEFDTVFTPDLTRAYVSSKYQVTVIDTLAMRQADADISTPAIDQILIPGNPFLHQITIDPLGHFVFVAGAAAAVYVIDARPQSEFYHKVIGSIPLPRPRITISGLAVTPDGKHLLVGTGTTTEELLCVNDDFTKSAYR